MSIVDLWLPILLSAVAVFVTSSIVWMALPYHKTDWKFLKDDGAFQDALRAQGLGAGMYMFPGCGQGAAKSPDATARLAKGPWGALTLTGGPPNMGRMLPLWFVHLVIVSVFVSPWFSSNVFSLGSMVTAALGAEAAAATGPPMIGEKYSSSSRRPISSRSSSASEAVSTTA